MLGRSGRDGGSEAEVEVVAVPRGVVMAEDGTDSNGAAKPVAPARSQGFGGDTVLDIVIPSSSASQSLSSWVPASAIR